MESITLTAQKRFPDETTKGELKHLRQEDRIPAVIYGREKDSVPVLLEGKEFRKVLSTEAGANVIIELNLTNGKDTKGDSETVMIKEIQRDILLKERILHVDLVRISLKEKQEVNIPLNLIGEAPGVKEGGLLQVQKREVMVSCLPTAIPDHIELEVSELQIGDSLEAKDLVLPEGVELLEEMEETLVSVLAPEKEEEPAEEEAEEEEGAEEAPGATEPEEEED